MYCTVPNLSQRRQTRRVRALLHAIRGIERLLAVDEAFTDAEVHELGFLLDVLQARLGAELDRCQ